MPPLLDGPREDNDDDDDEGRCASLAEEAEGGGIGEGSLS